MSEPGRDDNETPGFVEGATAVIKEEWGRWVLYLAVRRWRDLDGPLETVKHRIDDYSTRHAAEVAGDWIVRCANREARRSGPEF